MKALKLVFVAVALFVGVPLVVGSMGWSGSALVIYAIPSIVAMVRRHRNDLAIGATNLLLGWTLIGWVAALVWSLTDNTRQVQS